MNDDISFLFLFFFFYYAFLFSPFIFCMSASFFSALSLYPALSSACSSVMCISMAMVWCSLRCPFLGLWIRLHRRLCPTASGLSPLSLSDVFLVVPSSRPLIRRLLVCSGQFSCSRFGCCPAAPISGHFVRLLFGCSSRSSVTICPFVSISVVVPAAIVCLAAIAASHGRCSIRPFRLPSGQLWPSLLLGRLWLRRRCWSSWSLSGHKSSRLFHRPCPTVQPLSGCPDHSGQCPGISAGFSPFRDISVY